MFCRTGSEPGPGPTWGSPSDCEPQNAQTRAGLTFKPRALMSDPKQTSLSLLHEELARARLAVVGSPLRVPVTVQDVQTETWSRQFSSRARGRGNTFGTPSCFVNVSPPATAYPLPVKNDQHSNPIKFTCLKESFAGRQKNGRFHITKSNGSRSQSDVGDEIALWLLPCD